MKAIKKPIQVECIQWVGDNIEEIHKFFKQSYTIKDDLLIIHTDKGNKLVDESQFIIILNKSNYIVLDEAEFKENYKLIK